MKIINYYIFYYMLLLFEISYVITIRKSKDIDTKITKDSLTIDINDVDKFVVDYDVTKISNVTNANVTKTINAASIDKQENILINQKFCDFKKLKNRMNMKNKNNISSSRVLKVNESNSNTNKTTQGDKQILNNTNHNNISNTKQQSNKTVVQHTYTTATQIKSKSNITSEEILNIIADQTLSIKNEICNNCLEINNSLNMLIGEVKIIKTTLKNINDNQYPRQDVYIKLSNCINNLNLIKADLYKLNEFLDTLQKASCENYSENSKKYTLVVNSTNKLLEIIQNVLKRLNININLVVLN